MTQLPESGFGLYIHWPFCESKCPYCDFNSHVADRIDHDIWLNAYLSEIERVSRETSDRVLTSIFFGGGTPSLMAPKTVSELLNAVKRSWRISNDIEVTMEANPGSVEAAKFKEFLYAGVNRLSIGVQALNDADLRRLGRMHSATEARRAIDIAMSTFDRVSFDLIYARQNQSLTDWHAELQQALAIGTKHLSLYQLTVEDGTVFQQRHSRGQLGGLPNDDLSADMYDLTQTLCDDHGLPAYEVSNHSTPGQESRHNLIYWRGGDYIGIGPGAHGRITLGGQRYATDCFRQPKAWLTALQDSKSGESVRDTLPQQEILIEYLMMGLRVSEGISIRKANFLGLSPATKKEVSALVESGHLVADDHTVKATRSGRLVLNAVIRALTNTI
ncbi:MAG: radical SAM family heme chaperone HemW [Gemmobacter sp.]|nr:radical SAM family heme chaperone HemW [Gemmobacter sp.]